MTNKNITIDVIIPARMGSSRFPGKPLARICGIPMIEHVYKRCQMSQNVREVYVATCDKVIEEHIINIGGKAIMTSNSHTRCTGRTLEAVEKINSNASIIVMVQGDEPLIHPFMIDEAIAPMIKDSNIHVTNLMAPILSEEEINDKNEIKVVTDKNGNALFFSREPIPTNSNRAKNVWNKQVCVIPFTRKSLNLFESLHEGPLELAESIDMLRFLENGLDVKMVRTQYESYSVDTKEDLKKVEKLMLNDKLFQKKTV